jgi:superoxide dismutase, Fe-Mn family
MEAVPHVIVIATVLFAGLIMTVSAATTTPEKAKVAHYEAADFSKLLGMKGFSDTMLNNHFKLYQGYVKNTNLLLDKLSETESDATDPVYAELKRRFAFEFDGMRLHESYFGNLGGNASVDSTSTLARRIEQDFGSFDAWKKDFIAVGSMRGVGWAILYEDPTSGRLMNFWIAEHQNNHPAGCAPILVMDVWEHAYMTDYQLDRKAYIQAFWDNIDWSKVQSRYLQVAK